MAVNEYRSMNQDLREGVTDGVVKKINPNRGGYPNDDSCFQEVYAALSADLYDPILGLNPAEGYMADRVTMPRR